MKYLLMIYMDEGAGSPLPQDEVMRRYRAFDADITAAGVKLAAEALEDTSTATSVRVRDGRMATTDGPFAETKEQLAGFYLLDCPNLDDAIRYAAKIPAAGYGTIEVRPIWEIPPAPQD
jgi:hypothetical protein